MVDIIESVEKLDLKKNDILLIKIKSDIGVEYIEAIITTLKEKYGWNGMIILQRAGENIEILSEDAKMQLYEKLKQLLNIT